MKQHLKIESVYARQILDSRGNPTVEVEVIVEGGFLGRASVPSGASTGSFEAVELRDNDKSKYLGRGVSRAVENINNLIAPKIEGMNVLDQVKIDKILLDLDGTKSKKNLGANALLGVSLAVAIAASEVLGLSLYNYIGGVNAKILPVPMMNILNGGKHSDNNLNIQEFMIVPVGAKTFEQATQMCVEVYHVLKSVLKEKKLSTAIGDEGGFAPNLAKDEDAILVILESIEKAGYIVGDDFMIALDVAATEMYEEAKKKGKEKSYYFWKSDVIYDREGMIKYFADLVEKYPIVSIEDALAEEDFEGWKELTDKLGEKVQLVGDDLFVTNTERIKYGIKEKIANSVLIKPNQIGTLTETIDAISMARNSGYTTIISHRSGETEDTTIADIAVALNIGQIKTGAPCRTDRVCKYNELLRIEEKIGKASKYLGKEAFKIIKKKEE